MLGEAKIIFKLRNLLKESQDYNHRFYKGSDGSVRCSLPPVDHREELLYHCQPRSSYPGRSCESESFLPELCIPFTSSTSQPSGRPAWEMYSIACRVIFGTMMSEDSCTYGLTLKKICRLDLTVEE